MNHIKVTVEGISKSGKSHIAAAIAKTLQNAGIEAEILDEDTTSEDLESKLLSSLGYHTKVRIRQVRTPRTSGK